MPWKPEAYSIILPDPHGPDLPWIGVGCFPDGQEAFSFVSEKLGGDERGRIGLLSYIQGEGWLVDLPNPVHPEGTWVFVESFDRKRDALRFVKEKYGADSRGRLKVVDTMEGWEEPRGPKDWSPRWPKAKR